MADKVQKDNKKVKKQKKSLAEKEEEAIALEMSKQNYLKPAEYIIDRIKWDYILNKELEHFIIGYKDRFVGIMEINIPEFERCDTIPQHRIYYIKLYDQIIWDREKRIDLVSNNQVYKYSKNPATPTTTPIEAVNDQVFEKKQDDSESAAVAVEQVKEQEEESIVEQQKEQEEEEDGPIVFPKRKNRKIYQMYNPEDSLEKWMVSVNNKKLAAESPNYVSQRGGCYFIEDKDLDQFYKVWAASVQANEKFWMEEERTHLFRLYVDIDIKLTDDSSPYNIIEQGWIQMMSQIASEYFEGLFGGAVDTTCLVTECHSAWSDANTVSAKYKSGYRVYFLCIYVDTATLTEFMKVLAKKMKKYFDKYPNQPKDWAFTSVIDVESSGHTKARMFGTVKFRRGNEIPRKYSFAGLFKNKTGELNEEATQYLKSHVECLCRLTSVRLVKGGDNSNVLDSVVVSSQTKYREKVPLHEIPSSLL